MTTSNGSVIKASSNTQIGSQLDAGNPTRWFECTYGCDKTFSHNKKGDWKRHEASKHDYQEEYICMLNGAMIEEDNGVWCLLCGKRLPRGKAELVDMKHVDNQHNAGRCRHVLLKDRNHFKRLDHLRQHVKNQHGPSGTKYCQHWRRDRSPPKTGWGCGFCGEFLSTWNIRADHIGTHFITDGMRMAGWDGNQSLLAF
jgi:hypothetical protein